MGSDRVGMWGKTTGRLYGGTSPPSASVSPPPGVFIGEYPPPSIFWGEYPPLSIFIGWGSPPITSLQHLLGAKNPPPSASLWGNIPSSPSFWGNIPLPSSILVSNPPPTSPQHLYGGISSPPQYIFWSKIPPPQHLHGRKTPCSALLEDGGCAFGAPSFSAPPNPWDPPPPSQSLGPLPSWGHPHPWGAPPH